MFLPILRAFSLFMFKTMTSESRDPGILAPINFNSELGPWHKFQLSNLRALVAKVDFLLSFRERPYFHNRMLKMLQLLGGYAPQTPHLIH